MSPLPSPCQISMYGTIDGPRYCCNPIVDLHVTEVEWTDVQKCDSSYLLVYAFMAPKVHAAVDACASIEEISKAINKKCTCGRQAILETVLAQGMAVREEVVHAK